MDLCHVRNMFATLRGWSMSAWESEMRDRLLETDGVLRLGRAEDCVMHFQYSSVGMAQLPKVA